MIGSPSVDVLLLIGAMSAVTYATKAGGFWLISRVDIGSRTTVALKALPGAIVVSIVGVELSNGGVAEWGASLAVLIVAAKTENVVVALLVGVVAVVWLRAVL